MSRESDIERVARALEQAGIERGYVGAENVRLTWAARIVDSGFIEAISNEAYDEGYSHGYNNGFDAGFWKTDGSDND